MKSANHRCIHLEECIVEMINIYEVSDFDDKMKNIQNHKKFLRSAENACILYEFNMLM